MDIEKDFILKKNNIIVREVKWIKYIYVDKLNVSKMIYKFKYIYK